MMSTNNVLSPANGAPIIVPSQDMVLGIYYVSMERKGMKGEGMIFAGPEEVEHAMSAGLVHLHTKIVARVKQIDEEGNEVWKRYDTTPGRVRLGAMLPLNAKAPFELMNRLLRKKEVQQVIDTVYRYCGQKESVIFCDQIMDTGFKEAFKAGISFGKDDMLIPGWHRRDFCGHRQDKQNHSLVFAPVFSHRETWSARDSPTCCSSPATACAPAAMKSPVCRS
jgi:DNA-directed RNA polymerase subunit beta'